MLRPTVVTLAVTMAAMHAPRESRAFPADEIRAIIADEKGVSAPGCAVGLYQNGKAEIISSGFADLENRKPIDGNTQFYAASVSKQFTALAVAQLVVSGRIALDDDIRKYLPELREFGTPITVAMLMHHTAGIRDFLALGSLAGYKNSGSMAREEALAIVLAQQDTNFTPGTQHDYSNGGYLLLSEIVSRVSGMAFPDYVGRHIFKPLGMNRSYVLAGQRVDDRNLALGYARADGDFALSDAHPLFGGAGGVMLTANDLAKYDRDIHVGHKVWTPAVKRIMLMPGTLADGTLARVSGSNLVYAGGVMLYGNWVEHGGAAEGYRTSYGFLPEHKLGYSLLCNRNDYAPMLKAQQILKVVDPSLPDIAVVPVSAAGPNGRYTSDELPVMYELADQGAKLVAVIRSRGTKEAVGEPIVLYRAVDGSYLSENRWTRLVFDADRRGFAISTLRANGVRFRRVND